MKAHSLYGPFLRLSFATPPCHELLWDMAYISQLLEQYTQGHSAGCIYMKTMDNPSLGFCVFGAIRQIGKADMCTLRSGMTKMYSIVRWVHRDAAPLSDSGPTESRKHVTN